MLKLNSITHDYVGRLLFRDINIAFNSKKYGLVGPNGSGKSTLAQIAARIIKPTTGTITGTNSIVYLDQYEERPKQNVLDYISNIWSSANSNKEKIALLLTGIPEDLPLNAISGGEWMKLRIANLIKEDPQFIILDEPTNDLDTAAREIIYQFIREFNGGMLLISHDREALFLMDEILELSNQGIQSYGGNYEIYEKIHAQEMLRQEKILIDSKYEREKRKRERVEKIHKQEKRMREGKKRIPKLGLPRIIIGSMKRTAQKTEAKLSLQESEFVLTAEQENALAWEKQKKDPFIRFDFESCRPANSKVHFSSESLNFRYFQSNHSIWKEPKSFLIKGSERWLFSGKNGSGKSTLIKLLLGELEKVGEITGEIYRGISTIAYLDQSYGKLNLNISLLDNIRDSSRFNLTQLRNELAFFGFTKSMPEQKVSELSGGEKLKAALALTFLGKRLPDIMILDEPTNNLDLQSIQFLETALRRFSGAIVLISHDKYFIQKMEFDNELKI